MPKQINSTTPKSKKMTNAETLNIEQVAEVIQEMKPELVEEQIITEEHTSPFVAKYNVQFDELIEELQQWRSKITLMISQVKTMQKSVEKELKYTEKKKKKKTNKPKREPSGFAKPTEISQQLCNFLNKPYGTEMARTEVTKYINEYIKSNNLQQTQDKRKIVPDNKLSQLLGCDKSDEVTYFNLQKWMKPHFSSAQQQET